MHSVALFLHRDRGFDRDVGRADRHVRFALYEDAHVAFAARRGRHLERRAERAGGRLCGLRDKPCVIRPIVGLLIFLRAAGVFA